MLSQECAKISSTSKGQKVSPRRLVLKIFELSLVLDGHKMVLSDVVNFYE